VIETAVIVSKTGSPIFWHVPEGVTSGSIPDDRGFWQVIWGHRDVILGIAHTHPGSGPLLPSITDLTTFSAVERGLGQRLNWWIANKDCLAVCQWSEEQAYATKQLPVTPNSCERWIDDLRRLSGIIEEKNHG